MKKIFFFLSLLLLSSWASAQEKTTIRLSPEKIEALFIEQNLELIAEKMNIDIADATISQAKLWNNPELSISDVNLWSTKNQREGEDEVIPPLFGSFAKNTEFSIELSQLIQTANKRGKLISKEKVSKEIAIKEFEETLRGLKIELRKSIYEIIYLQSYLGILNTQEESIHELTTAYKKQVELGNIAKTELLRLQSLLLDIDNEINETKTDLNEQQKELKVLINADPLINIVIESENQRIVNPDNISLAELLQTAIESRTDIKRQQLQTKLHEKSLAYEKAMRVPDITLSANYDRHGGVWKNFIGFGVSFELPFLNRNQGNIKIERFSRDQSYYMEKQQQNIAQHEVTESFNNYMQAYRFLDKISNNGLLSELDSMMDIYTKNLLKKNISMLEYIDFMDAYKSNKQTVLTARKKTNMLFEELQFVTGNDIK